MADSTSLLLGLIFGSIGIGYCIYGRKQKHTVAFFTGLALIGLPYVIENNVFLCIVSIVLMFLPKYIKV